ncbi:hypothetical protein D3Z48_03850 [Clostridiaceae bacterium]|nr:hypothetical protein [Clostridiaceae bacterium]
MNISSAAAVNSPLDLIITASLWVEMDYRRNRLWPYFRAARVGNSHWRARKWAASPALTLSALCASGVLERNQYHTADVRVHQRIESALAHLPLLSPGKV